MIIEFVSFRLRSGVEPEQFRAAVAEVDDFLVHSPGFVSREVYRADDGVWFDLVWWRDMNSATNAAAAIRDDARATAFLDLLDKSSIQLSHAVRAHRAPVAPDEK